MTPRDPHDDFRRIVSERMELEHNLRQMGGVVLHRRKGTGFGSRDIIKAEGEAGSFAGFDSYGEEEWWDGAEVRRRH